ncbi:MAG: xylulokinase [Clostridia bacterium]|nr:xylulokinase [Clostridia bacterium]
MENTYLIGIDVGTSGTKSVLFLTDGTVVASAMREYPMEQPQNGWAEQDPAFWWNAVKETLKEITKHADGKIAAVGLSGQMHSLVLLDENGNVLRPSILWCDQRTAKECEEIEETVGHDRLIEITANPALPGFTASKIRWIKKHEPEIYARTAHILLAKDYIRWKLTGEYATEVSDASGMQLLDVKGRCWSAALCAQLGVDLSLLGKVYESADVTGYITKEAAEVTGLPCGIPVAGGAGDNAAAAIGTGVCRDGKAFTTIGTSGVVFAHTSTPIIDPKGRIHTFCAAVPRTWHVMGVTQAAGLSLNWFRRNFAPDVSYKEIDEACAALPIGAERLLYLPYLMGERTPILDSDARGAFIGLSAIHTKFHLARAVIEGVSYSLCDSLGVLCEVGVDVSEMALCGGGGKSPFWHRMITDLYGIPVHTMQSEEGAALGAAILAGTAAGVYPSVEAGCDAAVKANAPCTPNKESHERYRAFYGIYRSLYPALKETYRAMKI